MKALIKTLLVSTAVGVSASLNAQTVTVDPTTLTLGYMNWQPTAYTLANFPADGGTGSSAWGLSALQANFSGTTLTLQPNVNTYTPGNAYWNNPDGTGANQMDANIYNETTGTYVGVNLTFTADVISDTLAAPYSSFIFIKDFVNNYSSSTSTEVPLTLGVNTISLLTSANVGDHIQYGFETYGPDTNPASLAALESVVITPVPEPASLALLALGLPMFLIRRRK
jgi:PEP-CTERM motif-containing protein